MLSTTNHIYTSRASFISRSLIQCHRPQCQSVHVMHLRSGLFIEGENMECLKPVKTDKGSNVNKHILLTNINAIVSVERFCLLIILLLLGDCLPKNDWMFWSNVEWWTQNLTRDRGASLWETKGINNRKNQEASNKIYGRLYWQTSQSISTLHPFLTENLTVLNHSILLNFHYSCTTNQASLSLWNCVKRFNSKVDVLRSMVKINWTVYLEPAVLTI